jgi:hypothetical protein
VRKPIELCTQNRLPDAANCDTGANISKGSYFMLGYSSGTRTSSVDDSSSVYPSAGAEVTAAMPMVWLAPGLFSTMTVCFSAVFRCSA